MTRPTPRNLAASVRDRLLQRARELEEPFQYVLMRYGLERLMYRLSLSEHARRFTVKGALLFLVWTREAYRSTKDLDLMTKNVPAPEELAAVFQQLCHLAVEADGLLFLAETLCVRQIREQDVYGGIRVTLEARLDKARIPLQVDIGFGDAVSPAALVGTFPTLLEMPAPRLPMYARETVVAEKYQILVQLGLANSRMKDYFDLWVLAREFAFDGVRLTPAIQATFHRRQTALPEAVPIGLSERFAADTIKQTQWAGFLNRSRLRLKEPDMHQLLRAIAGFILPPSNAVRKAAPFPQHWPANGPWQPK